MITALLKVPGFVLFVLSLNDPLVLECKPSTAVVTAMLNQETRYRMVRPVGVRMLVLVTGQVGAQPVVTLSQDDEMLRVSLDRADTMETLRSVHVDTDERDRLVVVERQLGNSEPLLTQLDAPFDTFVGKLTIRKNRTSPASRSGDPSPCGRSRAARGRSRSRTGQSP